MEIHIPILMDVTLSIANSPHGGEKYPTSRLQKGLLMSIQGQDLAEEAVGFGLPVVKQGLKAFFPGDVELEYTHAGTAWNITALYTLDLEEKITLPGNRVLVSKLVYALKYFLAAAIRRFPPIRRALTGLSASLHRSFGWQTSYKKGKFAARVKMTYRINEETGILDIRADLEVLDRDGVTEVIIMNEQGARGFDEYWDSSGVILKGDKIGIWDEVTAGEARFTNSRHKLAFSLTRVPGARLFRGREHVDSRLAWSGFGLSFSPSSRRAECQVKVEKLV
jgi:hypothetical protein